MATVGDNIEARNAAWSFGGEVAEHFDEHMSKSVPFYREGHELVAQASDFFLSSGSLCYDLGCSTGQLLVELEKRNRHKKVRLVGIEVEPGMVKVAQRKCAELAGVSIVEADLLDADLEPADMIVSYYTMQFIKNQKCHPGRPAYRKAVTV